MSIRMVCTAAAGALLATASTAQEQITQASATFQFQGEQIVILQDNTQGPTLVSKFAKPMADCAESCFASVHLAKGVNTLGEDEVLAFLQGRVADQTGLMVDARMPQDRAIGYIPGSVSLPHATLHPTNGYSNDILTVLGAVPSEGGFDFATARHLLVYDVGPATDDAGLLVQHLLDAGYPAERISYYRGGMLMWAALGLSVRAGS